MQAHLCQLLPAASFPPAATQMHHFSEKDRFDSSRYTNAQKNVGAAAMPGDTSSCAHTHAVLRTACWAMVSFSTVRHCLLSDLLPSNCATCMCFNTIGCYPAHLCAHRRRDADARQLTDGPRPDPRRAAPKP